jgi:hypothetical protein
MRSSHERSIIILHSLPFKKQTTKRGLKNNRMIKKEDIEEKEDGASI